MMRGVAYMVSAIALLSIMDAMAKWLTMNDVPAIQILAIRSVIIIPVLMLVFLYRDSLSELKPRNIRLHAYRGMIGFVAPLSFFLGIKLIPLTDAVVVFFSSIFIITLLSIVFLDEKVGLHRWASIIVGFIGVVIVAGPKGGGQLSGYALVLLGSASYAVLFVSGRYLSATESVASLVLSYNLSVGIISLAVLPFFWQPLSNNQYLLLVALALIAVSGHYLITLAFASAEASLIAPFEYTAILWAIAFDLIIWQTIPSATTGIGAIIIIASGSYIAHRERVRKLPAQQQKIV